jgi:hypothetical protein
LGVGEGDAAVDFQALAAGVAAVWLDEGVVDAWVLSQVNRKCRSRCGGMFWGSGTVSVPEPKFSRN